MHLSPEDSGHAHLCGFFAIVFLFFVIKEGPFWLFVFFLPMLFFWVFSKPAGGPHVTCTRLPFQITRRYAEFSSAVVSINQTFPNERINALLAQLQVRRAAGTEGGPTRPELGRDDDDDAVARVAFHRPRWRTLC